MRDGLSVSDDVWGITRQRLANLTVRERQIMELLQTDNKSNFTDAFQVLERRDFPNIWRFTVRVLTIILTTVACEQSFSFFKRTIHANMSEETAKIFLMARLSHYLNDYNL